MVSQKYRWDFIGLSTDDKPTSETSDKVVNGSTYYCSDTSKLYVYCDGTWYERKPLGGGGTSDFNDLSNRPKYNGSEMTGSTNIPEVKSYTAGTNVSISDQNVISATDTTYSDFTGTDGTAAGTAGLVPAPATTDVGKFLKADGTWDTAGGGGGITELTSADYNYPANNPTRVALWMLEPGIYRKASSSVQVAHNTSSFTSTYDAEYIIGRSDDGVYATIIAIKTLTNNETNYPIQYYKTIISSGSNATSGNYSPVTFANVINSLTSSYTSQPLSANQGKVLKDLMDSIAIRGAGAPTTSTVGQVGTLYEDTTNGNLYICTDATNPYVWEEVGAGGGGSGVVELTSADYNYPTTGTPTSVALWSLEPGMYKWDEITVSVHSGLPKVGLSGFAWVSDTQNLKKEILSAFTDNTVYSYTIYPTTGGINYGGELLTEEKIVQSTGTNQKKVMSQNAVTRMIYNGGHSTRVQIGDNSGAPQNWSVAILGVTSQENTIAIGTAASATARGAIALGVGSNASTQGVFDVGLSNASSSIQSNNGYNGSEYRLLTGLYDPQSSHDAATKGYVDPTTDSSAPTTATVGRLGQIQIDTTNNDAYMCVAVDNTTPAYTWKKITV